MRPMTAGDICEEWGINPTTLRYYRQHLDFPEPRWHVGGKRKTDCWDATTAYAWQRDRSGKTDYAAGVKLLRQLGSIKAAAQHARVPMSTFRGFLKLAGEEPPVSSALRVLKVAGEHADEQTAAKLRAASDALLKL